MTKRQRRFVELYATGLNGSLAARTAGYSERSCGQIAHAMLKKPEIIDAIARRLRRHELDAHEATARLAAQARGMMPTKVREVLSRDGEVVPLREFDAHAALDKIAKMLGLYDEKPVDEGPLLIVRVASEVVSEHPDERAKASTHNDSRTYQAPPQGRALERRPV
jgi:phage terminase small subunit